MSDVIQNTRIVLVRHGQSVDNVAGRISGWTDSALTSTGREQAQRMARHVSQRYGPTVIYASPLQRARHTAQPLVELTGAPLVIRPNLRELHFGVAEGLTVEEVIERHATVWAGSQIDDDLTFGWPGGETRNEFYGRVRTAFTDIVSSHPGETIAVVSHGGVISSLLGHYLEGNASAWRRYQLHNCALTEISSDNGTIAVLQWNQIDHLLTDELTAP